MTQFASFKSDIHISKTQPSLPCASNFRVSPISQMLGFGVNNEKEKSTIRSQNAIVPPTNKQFRSKMLKVSYESNSPDQNIFLSRDKKADLNDFEDSPSDESQNKLFVPTLVIPETHNGFIIHSHPQIEDPQKIDSPRIKSLSGSDCFIFTENAKNDINFDSNESSPSPSICPNSPVSPIFEILNSHPPPPARSLPQNNRIEKVPQSFSINSNIEKKKVSRIPKKKLLRIKIHENSDVLNQSCCSDKPSTKPPI